MNESEFKNIVSQNKDRVFSFACYFLNDRQDAEDITQEAFVRLWKNAERIEPPAVRPWLMRVTHNLCVDRARHKSFEKSKFRTLDGSALRRSPDCDPEDEFDRRELQEKVLQAMRKLPPHLQSVIILREMQGFSYQEIADIVTKPLNSIKVDIHRARHALRKQLAPFFSVSSGAGP